MELINSLKSKFHSLQTFFKHGLSEWTTWFGIFLFFVCYYHSDINILIKNVLNSPALVDKVIDGISGAVAFGFIMYKQKK